MARQFLVPINLTENEVQNFLVHNLTSDPTGIAGRIYFNTTGNVMKYYDGTQWVTLDASGEANTASNQGAGIGLFDGKSGVDLQFRSLTSPDSSVTITLDDPNNEVDLEVNPSNVDHDSLLNFVGNEHIDHTAVNITAGVGLSGGGNIASSFTIDMDINELTAESSVDIAADYVAIYDASAAGHRKVLLQNLGNDTHLFSEDKTLSATSRTHTISGRSMTFELDGLSLFRVGDFNANDSQTQFYIDNNNDLIVLDARNGSIQLGDYQSNGTANIVITPSLTVPDISIFNTKSGQFNLTSTGMELIVDSENSTGFTITDNRTTTVGLQYAADYSADFTARTLPDVGWVQDYVTTNAPTLTEEEVQDFAWNVLAGTQTLITVTYDDVANAVNFVVDEAAIDHDALTNFVANEHIDHSAVRVIAPGDTGLTVVNNDLTADIDVSVDITGTTATTTVADNDELLIHDTSVPGLRSITRDNFLTSSDINFNGVNTVTGLPLPVNDTDAASKIYVDTAINGFSNKDSVKVATTGNITLSGEQTIDGVLTSADRVLVKNQTNAEENGIYVSGAGAWTRAEDADSWDELISAHTWVEEGTTNGDSGWLCTVDEGGTLGTTSVTWTQYSGAGQITAGDGLTKAGNTIDVVAADATLTVNADDIAVNYDNDTIVLGGSGLEVANYTPVSGSTVAVKKAATLTGDGTTTDFTFTHNLNTQDVVVMIRETSAPYDVVVADIEVDSVNAVGINFASAPPVSTDYRVVVIG